MCQEESASLQRGMNFRLRGGMSVVLMSLRKGAPYADEVLENGKILIYEGHDVSRSKDGKNPKLVDQPRTLPSGKLTQNGLFFQAALSAKEETPELVRVYEKIHSGVWVFDGTFALVDAWEQQSGHRKVFKFKLQVTDVQGVGSPKVDLPTNRLIPTVVKLDVWKRDGGRCVTCGANNNLHFDHIIPYSRGGSSLVAENIQLLCARHNLQKHDQIV